MRFGSTYCLIFLLISEPLRAAPPQEKTVAWAQLREEVASSRLNGRPVTISVSNGKRVGSTLRRIEEHSLVVEPTPNTEKLWRAVNKEARIPRAEVAALRFTGRQGRHGLIGGLIGLAASGAIIGATAAGSQQEGPAAGSVFLCIPILALGGYFAGRHYDKPIPVFRIVP